MKSKFVSVALAAVMVTGVFTVAPAQASVKSLVVVDSYFDNRIGDTPITCVTGNSCVLDTKTKSTALTHPLNHGVAMVDVVKSKFPNVPVVALRAADAKTEMNVGHLVAALEWALQNKQSVSALSVSRRMNGNSHSNNGCDAGTTNTAHLGGKDKADLKVRELIASLKSNGIPVFVSTGNGMGNIVDYPACITDTNSVSTGSANKLGLPASVDKYNADTDYFVSTKSVISTNIFKILPSTTSTATALAAAKYVSESSLTKFVNVLN